MSWTAAIPLITAGVGLAGQVAAQRAASAAQGRAQEAQIAQGSDAITSRNYGTEQDARLLAAQLASLSNIQRSQIGLEAPIARGRQAALGDLLANLKDVNISNLPKHIPEIQLMGGLRPSALGAGSRTAGQGMTAQAVQALLSGSDVPPATDFNAAVMSAPELTKTPQAGKSDSFLNYLATIGQIAGTAQQSGILDALRRRQTGGGYSAGGSYIGE